MKRRVILVTDGDDCAQRAVEIAAANVGGRCISASAGNPTKLSGKEIINLIGIAEYDPVIVMVDDKGNTLKGAGEQAMEDILNSDEIEVLGVVAVASNTSRVKGVKVNYSIDKNGDIINKAVDKNGEIKVNKIVKGDTVDILNEKKVPVIIGVGDPGKMDGLDNCEIGAPIITKAMDIILKLNTKVK